MESISSNLGSSSELLFNRMQSDKAVKKAAPEEQAGQGGVGNILDSFGGILKEQMGQINNLQNEANQAMQTYSVGGDIELHNVIMAAEKADLSLQLAMQIRNKVISAYQEISHMQV